MSYITSANLGALGNTPRSGLGDIDWSQLLQTGVQLTGQVLPTVLQATGVIRPPSPPAPGSGGSGITPSTYIPYPGQPVIVQTPSSPASSTPSWLPWAGAALLLAVVFGMGGRRR